jgi:hypothetical protein
MASVSSNVLSSSTNAPPAPVSSTNSINTQLNNRIKTAESKPNNQGESAKPIAGEDGFMKQINSALDNTSNYIKSLTTSSTTKSQNNKPSGKPNTTAKNQSIPEPMMYVTDNYIIILGLFIAFITLVLLYFFSKTFNVGRVKEKMKLYNLYQKISDFEYRQSESGTLALKDVQVASAYNAANMGSQMLSYTSEHILTQVLRSGARYIELNIFSSKFGQDGIPVIDGGFKQGEWKLMLNSTTFEQAIITIAQNAFKPLESEGGAPNSGDPLFLALNLSTGHNIYCLDKVADILVDYFSDKLLEAKYAYQFNGNIQDIKMNDLQGKVVIFSSSGYEGSKLEELVNSTWVDETNGGNALLLSGTTSEGFTSDELNTIKKSTAESQLLVHPEGVRLMDSRSSVGVYDKSAPHGMDTKKATNIKKGGVLGKNKKYLNNVDLNSVNITNPSTDTELEDKSVKLSEVIKREFGNDLAKKSKTENTDKFQDVDIDIQLPTVDDNDGLHSTKPNIIRISASIFSNPGFDGTRLKNHNKTGITIVVPHVEGDYLTRNYDPTLAWDLGCQFVTMNYQEIDENMDTYITHFETKAILPITLV